MSSTNKADISRDLAALRLPRNEESQRHSFSRMRWVLIAAICVAAAVSASRFIDVKALLRTEKVAVGTVSVISPAQAEVKLMTTGYVVPLRRATVASKLVARVERMLVKEGEQVRADQILATLESADIKAQVLEAQAAHKTAQARVVAAEATLAEAQLLLQREKQLLERAATNQAAVDNAKSRSAVADANLQAANAEVETASARLVNARSALSNTQIRSPFSGKIVRKLAEAGEVPAAGAIAELVDFSSLVVEADLSESRVGRIAIGTPAEVTLDAFPDVRLRAKVKEIRPTVDRQKATVLTRLTFVDTTAGILPNMSAKILFLERELDEATMKEPSRIVVPAAAVRENAGMKAVFVLSEGKVRLTSVVLGQAYGGQIELKQGPSPGTKVVLDPPAGLRDGSSVQEK